MDNNKVWIFNGEYAKFSGGIFSTLEEGKKWIAKHRLTGILTCYPMNTGVYDWATENGYFEIKQEKHTDSNFIGGFTSASQEHYHFENGEKE